MILCQTILCFLIIMQIWNQQLAQHTTPIAKSHISVDANLVLSGEPFSFKKRTVSSIPPKHHRNTAKTAQKHDENMSKTQNITEHRQDLRPHRESATKMPTTTETQLRDHQDTSRRTDTINHQDFRTDTIRTDTTNSRKGPRRVFVFPKKLLPAYFVKISLSHHHHHNTVSTDIHHHQKNNRHHRHHHHALLHLHHHNHHHFLQLNHQHVLFLFHQPCPCRHHHHHHFLFLLPHPHLNTSTEWNLCIQVQMQTWILLTGVQVQIQIQRHGLTEFSFAQLPNEYMPYAGVVRKIYIDAGGNRCLEMRSGYMQVWCGRCKDAGGNQFLTDTYTLDCF